MTTQIGGIHHITAIAGDPQENVDFYAGVLGMRLVKRSVNQDDPGTYHLFYADAKGEPGSDLTFFPWTNMGRGRTGTGLTNEVALAVPPDALDFWQARLEEHGVQARRGPERFGEPMLEFQDPHGLHLALVASPRALERPFTPWERSAVPPAQQIRGLHAARVAERDAAATGKFATQVLGMRHVASDGGWERYEGRDGWSGYLEVRSEPGTPRGAWGVGTVHHVAWRARDDDEQLALRQVVERSGTAPTPVIDRFWFRSVYFREPGGVLFEIATDGPGFGVDEPMDTLGERLILPPWLEPHRAEIESHLAPLVLPPRIEVPEPDVPAAGKRG